MRALRMLFAIALTAVLAAGCSAAASDDDDTGTATVDAGDTGSDTSACDEEGDTRCDGKTYQVCENGKWTETECPDTCYPAAGCVLCPPGQTYCEGNTVMQCDPTGSSTSVVMDCADYSVECKDGECQIDDPCVKAIAEKSNIGCEYWAADLDNEQNSMDKVMGATGAGGQFAVAVANVGNDTTAHVVVEINNAAQGEPLDLETVETHDIGALDLYIFKLPRRDVDGGDFSDWLDDGPQTQLSSLAFRITSDVPVVAYQFNPLDQHYSNDATVLIPTSGLGNDHLIVGYYPNAPVDFAGSPKNRSYVTVLGVKESTTVNVTATYDVISGPGVPEMTAGTGIGIEKGKTATFTIGPFDVLNLETRFMKTTEKLMPDLTGSRVTSDKPVVVFSGSDMISLAFLPDMPPDFNSCCAEHIEHEIFPSAAMGYKFVASHSAQRNNGDPEYDFYRIIAYGKDDSTPTTVTTNLPSPDDQFTLAAGKYREFFANTGFVVDSDGPLHVAQFITAGTDIANPVGGAGDPSLLFFPSVEQRRGLYVFTTGEGFDSNWAVVSMAENTPVKIDGKDLLGECEGPLFDGTLDGIAYESWTCEISDGVHVVHSGDSPDTADYPIAVSVYGYYYAGSYAYTAGSDLRRINPFVPE
jgi:hypothetical protein